MVAAVFFFLTVYGLLQVVSGHVRLRHPRALAFPLSVGGMLASELTRFHALAQLAIAGAFLALGVGDTGAGQIGLGLTLASLVLLAGLELRARATRRAIARQAPTLARAAASPNPAPASRLWRPRHHESALVEIVRDIPYGDHPALRLDLHLPRGRENAPVVIQIHGGSWIRGKRQNQGRPLLRRLAEQGFIGVAIDYRLCPDGRLPDQVADVKRSIAWVRTEIAARGGDPEWIAVTGGSAGGHLATMAALTGNDPRYQPGFEQVDTRIRACVPYSGLFDLCDRFGLRGRASLRPFLEKVVMPTRLKDDAAGWDALSPIAIPSRDAPPMLVIHGASDLLAPVEEARAFVATMRGVGPEPVHYLELPGAHHAFEYYNSRRNLEVADSVVRFLSGVRGASPVRETALG